MQLSDLQSKLKKLADPKVAKINEWFFKTGEGEYGAHDKFLGIKVPNIKTAIKDFKNIDLNDVEKLIKSKFNEERLSALLIMVEQFKKASEPQQKKIVEFYLKNKKYVNNWNLVDSSAHKILGEFLTKNNPKMLLKMAKSADLWERRMAIISTLAFIKKGDFKMVKDVAKTLMKDKEDLIQKAVGWMLREMGKVNKSELIKFLDENALKMPRTMLRYAIEKLPAKQREFYLKLKKKTTAY